LRRLGEIMYTLLILDDEAKIAEGIANLFPWDQIGFRPVAFSDPGKALQAMESTPVDCVLTDIEMPGINGMEILRRMNEKGIPVVLISSHTDYAYFRSAIQFHAEDYLLKPLKGSDILTVFGRLKEKLDASHHVTAENPPSYYEKILAEVRKYIAENYQDASLEEAAVRVSLSPAYLSRLLREKSGIGFGEELQRVRMEKACELIADGRNKMYDIAGLVGYDNPKSFSRAFKANIGVTPMEYRNGRRPEKTADPVRKEG